MVNAKDAVKITFDYFQSLPFHNRDKITDLELEEVELSEKSDQTGTQNQSMLF